MWEKAAIAGENPDKHGEKMQILYHTGRLESRFKPITSELGVK